MVKVLFGVLLATLLVGCSSPTKIKTEVTEQFVPLLYCPSPPELTRPDLPIEMITEETEAGEVAKYYKATVLVLESYCSELESIVEQYEDTSAAYEELRNRFRQQWRTEVRDALETQ